MPPKLLPSNLPFESACYSITANGVRKFQQQRLCVFSTIKRTAATTIMQHVFYNPYCKSIEELFFAFPLKCGTRLKDLYCEIGELAWNVPEETIHSSSQYASNLQLALYHTAAAKNSGEDYH